MQCILSKHSKNHLKSQFRKIISGYLWISFLYCIIRYTGGYFLLLYWKFRGLSSRRGLAAPAPLQNRTYQIQVYGSSNYHLHQVIGNLSWKIFTYILGEGNGFLFKNSLNCSRVKLFLWLRRFNQLYNSFVTSRRNFPNELKLSVTP